MRITTLVAVNRKSEGWTPGVVYGSCCKRNTFYQVNDDTQERGPLGA